MSHDDEFVIIDGGLHYGRTFKAAAERGERASVSRQTAETALRHEQVIHPHR